MEVIETYEQLALYNKVGSPFSIPKAALALAGFLPDFSQETFPSLRAQLEHFGGGIELTLLSAIPAGSGHRPYWELSMTSARWHGTRTR